MSKTAFEEFYEEYEQPAMRRVTVGFSGIDPQRKAERVEQDEIKQVVLAYLSSLTTLDSGEIH